MQFLWWLCLHVIDWIKREDTDFCQPQIHGAEKRRGECPNWMRRVFWAKKEWDNLPRGSVGGLGPFRPVSRRSPPFLQSRPKNVTESGCGGRVVKISLTQLPTIVWDMGHCVELERSRQPSQTILINCVVVKCQKNYLTLLQIFFNKWDISAAQKILNTYNWA